jgi:hypothetical protein
MQSGVERYGAYLAATGSCFLSGASCDSSQKIAVSAPFYLGADMVDNVFVLFC